MSALQRYWIPVAGLAASLAALFSLSLRLAAIPGFADESSPPLTMLHQTGMCAPSAEGEPPVPEEGLPLLMTAPSRIHQAVQAGNFEGPLLLMALAMGTACWFAGCLSLRSRAGMARIALLWTGVAAGIAISTGSDVWSQVKALEALGPSGGGMVDTTAMARDARVGEGAWLLAGALVVLAFLGLTDGGTEKCKRLQRLEPGERQNN